MSEPSTTDTHAFDVDGIGQWSDAVEYPVTREHIVAYAEATNDPFVQHLEGTYAPPVYAVVPPFNLMAERTMSVVPDELMLRILHGEHDFRFHRPIVPGDVLTNRAKVVGITGKSSGVIVTTLLECRDADGDLVNEQYFNGFFRGGRWDGSNGEPPPPHSFDESLRETDPFAEVVQKFDEDQTFRYSEASGDPMPIHLDDEFAKSMGLPGIIIHGLCTMAFASHAVTSHASPDEPSRLKRLAVRFSSPAQPKHTVTTRVWNTGATEDTNTFSFETVTDDDTFVIKDGHAEYAV